jgi:hypothetical protein
VRNVTLASVVVRNRRLTRNVTEMRHVRCDQDELDAGQRSGLCEIKDLKTSVSVRAAQDKGVQTSEGDVVIRIAALSGDEPVILDPAYGLADSELGGGHCEPLANRSCLKEVTGCPRHLSHDLAST